MTTITPTIRQVTRTERDIAYRFALDALAPVARLLERQQGAVRVGEVCCWTVGEVVERVLEMGVRREVS